MGNTAVFNCFFFVFSHKDGGEASNGGGPTAGRRDQSQEAGRSEVMLVTGDGIDANAEAFVGSYALTSVMVRDTSIEQEDPPQILAASADQSATVGVSASASSNATAPTGEQQ